MGNSGPNKQLFLSRFERKSNRKQLLETGLSYHLRQVTWERLLKVQLLKLHPQCSASRPLGEGPMKQNS